MSFPIDWAVLELAILFVGRAPALFISIDRFFFGVYYFAPGYRAALLKVTIISSMC